MASGRKEDEEKLKRIEADRLEINAAYDNGYSNDSLEEEGKGSKSISGLNISDLQDKIDRYGFIHNEKLPAKLTETEIRRNNIEKLRESKWLDMLKNWSAYSNQSNSKFLKLQSRVFKGIPNSTRNIAWYKLLDVESQIKAQSGVYEKMKFLARKYSVDLRQIDLDINRTFRDNLAYKKRYCQRQVQLYNVLAAYSIYNTEIGYCQGMSNIAALLLMYLSDEERTFWALSQLMASPKYSMHGFFKKDFPKLIRFSDKHDSIIKELMPKLYKKFIKCNITSLLYTTKWFLQCYLDALPFSLVLRIWDVYLLKGEIVLLGMAYCILKMHKKFLVNKDMDEINEYLKNKLPNNFMFDDDIVMQKLESCIETLKRSKLGQLESVPIKELASQPFGTFKATNKQEMLSQSGAGGEKSSNENRLAALEKMASVRLEVEKKKQREERKRRKQERLAAAAAAAASSGGGGGASFGAAFINDGKPIKNISDEDDEDDGESEDDEDDDDDDDEEEEEDDDLNPSKLSEYEDERGEKASILSDLTSPQTRSSSEMQSQNSLDRNHRNNGKNKASRVSSLKQATRSSAERGASRPRDDDDLMRIPRNDNDYSVNLTTSSHHVSAHNSPVKFIPKGTREPNTPGGHEQQSIAASAASDRRVKTSSVLIAASNSNGVLNPAASEPQDARFSKVTAKPLGQMRENLRETAAGAAVNINRTTSMAFTSPTARVMSNPPPISPTHHQNGVGGGHHHINSLNSSNNNVSSSNSIFTNGYEYVRSPHGIYTRVNQLTRQSPSSSSLNASKLIQHSASNIQIAAVQAANSTSNTTAGAATTPIPISTKRTSSLRNVQPPPPPSQRVQHGNHHQPPERVTTPTKQQLHNHSLRIASIQQQQQQVAVTTGQPQQQQVGYPASISIISQAPKTTTTTTTFQQAISPNYYHRSSSSTSTASTSINHHTPTSSPSNKPLNAAAAAANGIKLKTALSQDIEQCDYI